MAEVDGGAAKPDRCAFSSSCADATLRLDEATVVAPRPAAHDGRMIFIVVRFPVLPDKADQWMATVDTFTKAVREEPGNLWFRWSRSVDDPNEFVLVEAFRDGAAGEAHVRAPHFAAALKDMQPLLAHTPRIVNVEVPDRTDWSLMGELEIPEAD